MTYKNSKSSCYVREYNGFDGIDRTRDSGGLSDVVNFRLMNDKSLKKREAAILLTALEYKPRAHYVADDSTLLLLSDRTVSFFNLSDLSQKTVGYTDTSAGKAQFFCYDGKIILSDGDDLYVCGNETLSHIDGYAPLYGKNWHPIEKGRVHQQMNLLSKHYRISYKIDDDDPSIFLLDEMSESVDAAYLDGVRISERKFTVDDGGFSISCSHPMQSGSVLTLFITAVSYPYYHDALKSCSRAALYGNGSGRGADVSSVAFYNGSDPAKIFTSRRIEKADLEETLKDYPDAMSIYVTLSDMKTVGNGRSRITAVCRRGGKLLVFTPDSAYALSESGDSSDLFNLSLAGGCDVPDGAASMGDSPVTVSKSGILKWSPVRYDSDEYVAECISAPIGGLPHPSFYTSAAVHSFRSKNEIWFTDPSSSDKRIFIYNTILDAWYCFCGIHADSFFEIGGKTGYFSGNEVYLFDTETYEDISAEGTVPIVGRIVTGRISFGSFDFKKRLFKLAILSGPRNTFDVMIDDASGISLHVPFIDRSGEQLGYTEKRIPAARSRYYTVSLTTLSKNEDRLLGMTMTAAK